MTTLPPRTAPDIIQALVAYAAGATPRISDYTPGSVIRTILETAALEIARLEVATEQATNEAIEQSAYLTFGFPRQGPLAAGGSAVFTLDSTFRGTLTIPSGTRVSVPGVGLGLYQTTTAATATLSGAPSDPQTLTVAIVAVATGSATNTPAGTITQIVTPIPGVLSVTNAQALFSGADTETDAERRARFAQFIRTLPRATKDAILVGALSTRLLDSFGYVLDAVRKANTVENDPHIPDESSTPPNPDNPRPGRVWVFCHNGLSTPSPQLVAACQQVLSGWEDTTTNPPTSYPGFKAAGIECLVFPAVEVVVPVQVTYLLDLGYLQAQVEPAITQAVQDYFAGLDVGDPLRVTTLARQIGAVPGVLDMQLVAPNVNYYARYRELVLPGQITITMDPTGS